jgi:hypothetical protein
MHSTHIRTKVESETLHLPELKSMLGKPVEIVIVELAPATREEFCTEAACIPETPEEQTTQRDKLRAWRSDPRFERFWQTIDRLLAGDNDTGPGGRRG